MLELKNISKTYRAKNGVTCRALNNVTLSFGETGLVFIVGKSGGGKSTLLNIIGALDKPDRGSLSLYGNDFSSFSNAQLDAYRNTYVGTVFQEYNLLPTLNARRNVSLALEMQGKRRKSREKADEIFTRLDITEIEKRRANQISGGQSQRVAIARALVKDPNIILADEPTGNLDSSTGAEMFEVFKRLSREKLVIIVTHDRETADSIGDRVIEIKDGRVYKDIVRTDKVYERCVDLVGDHLIRVPKKAIIDERALRDINEVLSANDRDTFIINERDVQKVKSLNIHVKNSVDLNATKEESNYYPYTPEPTEKKPIKLIKARMPFGVGLRLSLSTFKHKTFRLIVTVLMLSIALSMAAALSSFAGFDNARALAHTISADEMVNLYADKDATYRADAEFSEADLDMLANLDCVPVFSAKIPVAPSTPDVKLTEKQLAFQLLKNFTGFAECQSADDAGLDVLWGEGSLENFDSVVISKLAALSIARLGYFSDVTPDSLENLIGKKLTFYGKQLTVTGIYDCDLTGLQTIDDLLDSGWNSDWFEGIDNLTYYEDIALFVNNRDCLSGLAFVAPGFSGWVLTGTAGFTGDLQRLFVDGNMEGITVKSTADMGKKKIISFALAEGADAIYVDLAAYNALTGSYLDLSNERYFRYYDKEIKKAVAAFNKGDGIYSLNYPTDGSSISRIALYSPLRIKGVYMYGKPNEGPVIYVSPEIYQLYTDGCFANDAMLVRTSGEIESDIAMLQQLATGNFKVKNYSAVQYNSFVFSLGSLRSVLSAVLIITVAIAAVLLFSFVSASIKLEKRQIGILRAMGARGIDTFKTFAIEGALISLFSTAAAATACAILFPIANSALSDGLPYSAFFFIISPLTAAYMLATAALITVLGISVPLIRLIRMTPVDAINRGDNQR